MLYLILLFIIAILIRTMFEKINLLEKEMYKLQEFVHGEKIRKEKMIEKDTLSYEHILPEEANDECEDEHVYEPETIIPQDTEKSTEFDDMCGKVLNVDNFDYIQQIENIQKSITNDLKSFNYDDQI